jgi:hypothetical protein
MSGKRHILRIALASAAAAVSALVPATAHAAVAFPIGPNTYFQGQVNGVSANAQVKVICVGPLATGHAAAGQYVDAIVTAPITNTSGYTGSAAHEVVVTFGPSAASAGIILTSWSVAVPIPTTLILPCGGTGTVTFTPEPTSNTARASTVSVRFFSLGV